MAVDGPERGDITRLLQEWKDGQPDALQQLIPLVYPDLKRIAYGYLQHEKPGHTLQATGLVHELYLRLCNQREANWEDRSALLHLRRENHAYAAGRSRAPQPARQARRQEVSAFPWTIARPISSPGSIWPAPDIIDLDARSMNWKASMRAKPAWSSCAICWDAPPRNPPDILHISLATAERDLKFARGWLYRRLRPDQEPAHG